MNALSTIAPAKGVLEGEVLPPQATTLVQRNPFVSAKEAHVALPEGSTLDLYVLMACKEQGLPDAYTPHLRAYIGEHEVPRDLWTKVRPKAGQTITVRVLPQGKAGKNILRAVIMIAVVVAAYYIAGPAVAGMLGVKGTMGIAAVSAATAMTAAYVANLGLNALIPPPRPDGGSASSRPTITSSQNRFNPYGPIPRVFGRTRIYPVMAAHPYTEIVGKQQYLRLLLCAGFGPLKLTDLRIGNTPITAFDGVNYEIHEGGPDGWAGNAPITLYNRQVREEQLSVELINGAANVRTSEADCNELSVDIAFPRGLITYTKKGAKQTRTVNFSVRYRRDNGDGTFGAWSSPTWLNKHDRATETNGVLRGLDATQENIIISGRWKVAPGQYQVEVKRTTPAGQQVAGGKNEIDTSYWTALRSVTSDQPVNMEGVALIALRIKATDQLNGVIQNLNCLAEAYLPVRDAGTGAWAYTLTRNAAWAYADVLRRRGNETLIADTRIDLAAIQAWAAACDATAPNAAEPMWMFDGVVEGGSVFQTLRRIAAVGRASFVIRDGKYSVVRDLVQATPVQHITPKNSWGYSGTKTFVELPHALKVRFINEDKEYKEDEILVFADGYDESNATIFDTLELFGASTSTFAWREGRYHLAVGRLRPEEHRVSMDIEALRCTMGDRVQLSHDVILVGQAYGRVQARVGTVTGLILDEEVTFEAGKAYSLRVRHADGSSSIRTVTPPGAATTGTFTEVKFAAEGEATAPEPGDLFMFGETGLESMPCVVKRIERGDDLSTDLTLVAYDPGIQSSATEPIPPFTSYMTDPVTPQDKQPTAPTITLRSDDSVIDALQDGSIVIRLAVDLATRGGTKVPIEFYEVQWRELGGDQWRPAGRTGRYPFGTATAFVDNVRPDAVYEVRARSISHFGRTSDWTVVGPHTIVGKTISPDEPSGATVTPGYRSNGLRWTNGIDTDLAFTEVYASQTNDFTSATVVGRTLNGLFTHQNLPADDLPWYYWLRSVDLAENASAPIYAGSGTALKLSVYEGIGADNSLHPQEKLIIKREWSDLQAEKAGLNAQATALAVTTQNTAYNTAYTALNTYLTGLSPAYDNMSAVTPVVRATWNSKWSDLYTARQALLNALDTAAAKRADWEGVEGRPANLAELDALAATSLGMAVDAIDKMTDDGMITVAEKGSLKRQHQALMARYRELLRRAATVGVYPAGYNQAFHFANPTNGTTQTNLAVAASATAASDGTMTADKITRTSTTAGGWANARLNTGWYGAAAVGTIKTVSIEAKRAAAGGYFGLRMEGTWPERVDMVVDLSNGAIVHQSGSNGAHVLAAEVEDIGGGWYRLYLTGYNTVSTWTGATWGPTSSDLIGARWHDASATLSDCYVWGHQIYTGIPRQPVVATSGADTTQDSTSDIADKAVTAMNDYVDALSLIHPAWGDTSTASALRSADNLLNNRQDQMGGFWAVEGGATRTRDGEWVTITDTSTSTYGYLRSAAGNTVPGLHTVQFEIRKDATPASTRFPILRVQFTAGSLDIRIDTSTGEVLATGSLSAVSLTSEDWGDRWFVTAEVVAPDTATYTIIQFYPAVGSGALTDGYFTTWTGSAALRNPQVFYGSLEDRRRASLDEKVTAFAKALDELATLTRQRLQPLATEFYEDFSGYANVQELRRNWNFTNPTNIGLVASADTGGQALRSGDYVGTNDYQVFDPGDHAWVAYSPEDLYEITVDMNIVKADVDAVFFIGVEGKDSAGTSLGNAHNYVAAFNLKMTDYLGRRTYRGYMRGFTTGNAVQANSPDNPSPIRTGIVKIRPKIYLAYPTAATRDGVAYVHSIHLRKVGDVSVTWTGAWSSARTYYMNEGVTYLGRAFASKISGNINNSPPGSATSNAYWYLVADKGTDGSNGANGTDGVDGDDGAGQYTLVHHNSSTTSPTPNSILQTVAGAWVAGAYTLESYVGGAYVSFRASTASGVFMVGLNSDPTTNASYTSIDYALYCTGSGGALHVYESGTSRGQVGTYTTNDVLAIHYDGKKVRYYKNGVVIREVAAAPNLRLYLDSSFGSTGAKAQDIAFSAAGAAGTSPISVTAQPESLTFQANADGSIKEGQLPKAITNTVLEGDTAVPVTSITILTESGCDASVSGATVNIDLVTAPVGFVEYTVNAAGQSVKKRVEFNTVKDAATQASVTQQIYYKYQPANPGAPGQITDSGILGQIGDLIQMSPSGAGKIKVSIDGWYKLADFGPAHDVSATLQIKYQYRVSPSGAWVDIATINGTPARSYFNGGTGGYNSVGTIQNQTIKTALTVSEIYDMRILARMINETGTTNVPRFDSYNLAFFVGQEA